MLGRLVDGVDACRKAAREEIKAGAEFIKVMANGGVASPPEGCRPGSSGSTSAGHAGKTRPANRARCR
jgi:hypothetical protein